MRLVSRSVATSETKMHDLVDREIDGAIGHDTATWRIEKSGDPDKETSRAIPISTSGRIDLPQSFSSFDTQRLFWTMQPFPTGMELSL
jgi:hypothetical protein